jgi:hypothetical protein
MLEETYLIMQQLATEFANKTVKKDERLKEVVMSCYMAGFETGYFNGKQDVSLKEKGKYVSLLQV